jgi:glycosyltransferase involved in cell wall biosynthesis
VRLLFYYSARGWSGEARVFAAAARGLHARGHQITYVCAPESAVEQKVASSGHDVVPMRSDGWWALSAFRLRRALAGRFVEVAFVHTPREHKVASLAAFLAERSAVIRRIPSGAAAVVREQRGFGSRLAATGVLVGSDEDLRDLPVLKRLRFEPSAAPLGVDVEAYDLIRSVPRPSLGAGESSALVVGVCDQGARARAATMLRAVALLAPNHPDLRLALVGPGSDDEDLRMHAAALGLTKIVAFAGEREDYLAVLRAANLGWVVSSGDAAAFACLDFMAMKVPVLAERGPLAGTYVADGITGLLLPSNDAPATAAALARLLAHNDQRTAMGTAGRSRVAREFTEAAMLDGFERAASVAADRSRWKRK